MSSLTQVYSLEGLTDVISPPVILDRDPTSSDLDFVPGTIIQNRITNVSFLAGTVAGTFTNLSSGGGSDGSVSQGGTGRNSLNVNEILIGGISPTSPVQQISLQGAGTVLTSTGLTTPPRFENVSAGVSSITGQTGSAAAGAVLIVGNAVTNTVPASTISTSIVTSSSLTTNVLSISPTKRSFVSNITTATPTSGLNYNATIDDYYIEVVDASVTTIVLPGVAAKGQIFAVQLATTALNSGIGITAAGPTLINGSTSPIQILTPWEGLSFLFDGSQYVVLGSTGGTINILAQGASPTPVLPVGTVGNVLIQGSVPNAYTVYGNNIRTFVSPEYGQSLVIGNTPQTYMQNITSVGGGSVNTYTLNGTESLVLVNNNTSGNFSIILPGKTGSVSAQAGQVFMIKDALGTASSSKQIVITAGSGASIDTSSSAIKTNYGSVSLCYFPDTSTYYQF